MQSARIDHHPSTVGQSGRAPRHPRLAFGAAHSLLRLKPSLDTYVQAFAVPIPMLTPFRWPSQRNTTWDLALTGDTVPRVVSLFRFAHARWRLLATMCGERCGLIGFTRESKTLGLIRKIASSEARAMLYNADHSVATLVESRAIPAALCLARDACASPLSRSCVQSCGTSN